MTTNASPYGRKTPPVSRTAVRRTNTRRKNARRRRRRNNRIKKTLLLLFLLLLIVGAGIGIIYMLRGGNMTTMDFAYSTATEFSNTLSAKENLRADPFAENLCVVGKDVDLPTATLQDSQAGLLLDMNRKKVLYSRRAFERVYPASITKIATAVIALTYGDMNETVTIRQSDVELEEQAQVCGFMEGDQLKMDQLLRCLLVYSGNDAAAAIARHVGGSVEEFVSLMNSYAASIGCTGTHFTNPHGLPDVDHYTTPYDIYLMLNEAIKYPEFTEITQLSEYTVNYTRYDGSAVSTRLEATDHYLTGEATAPKNVVVLGGKTGTTSAAGNCLAILVQNAYGEPFTSIVMGASSKEVLYSQMNSLLQNINGRI
ncbi:MAG: D-alanyl-D-alanine carboxypeptidase [Blautia sp.]|nr:D-alanyl-D-alanine carboxypeptidase [Blautia sp.]